MSTKMLALHALEDYAERMQAISDSGTAKGAVVAIACREEIMATFTPKEAALYVSHACDTSVTAKQLRGFIRRMDEKGTPVVSPVGSGARYAFTVAEVHALAEAYSRTPITSGTPAVRSLDAILALVDATPAEDATPADGDGEL